MRGFIGINVDSLSKNLNIDIFAIKVIDGKSCIHGKFYRNGSNYGNKSFFPIHEEFTEEKEILEIIQKMISVAPSFGYSLFERYIRTFCHGKISELRPFTITNLKKSADSSSKIQMELLEGFSKLQKIEREDALVFLKKIE